MRKNGLLSLLGLPLSALIYSGQAHADFYLHHWENHRAVPNALTLDLQAAYFESNTNFDPDGLRYIPSALSLYQRIQTDLGISYGWSPQLSFYGRAAWARIELQHTSRPGNGYGFTDQTLGANFRVFKSARETGLLGSIDLQAQLDFPLYDNSVADANLTPHLGDQSMDATIGAFLTSNLHKSRSGILSLSGGLGYTYRTLSYSAALPWSVAASFEPNPEDRQNRFGGQLAILGVASLSTDPRGSSLGLTSSAFTSPGTGGSYMSAAINPSLATLRGRLTVDATEELRFFAQGATSLFGGAAPGGTFFSGGMEFSLDGPARGDATKHSASMTPEEYGKANQGFISYAFEARVLRVNDRLNMIKLDKGSSEGVQTGQIFDIFKVNPDRSPGEAIARARVTSVKTDEAALTITEYFKEVWIEEGFIAKRPLH
ncbi:MAG: hypothetical protein NDJ89_11850 [Oligoflexia bacterium]|nr:hypothetical protein [Oligoflexia bacterium]